METLTEEQLQYINENLNKYGKKNICEKFNVSRKKLDALIIKYNINYDVKKVKDFTRKINAQNQRFKFNDEQIEFIKKNIDKGKSYIIKELKCPLDRLNEVMEINNIVYEKKNIFRTKNGTFQKGHTPHNKGTKIDKNSDWYKNLSKTFFQKGRNGFEQKYKVGDVYQINSKGRKYWYYYLGNNTKIPYKKYLWQEAGNITPKGWIVVCKDIYYNEDIIPKIDDLICVPRTVWRIIFKYKYFPPELLETQLKTLKLNYIIKNKIIIKN